MAEMPTVETLGELTELVRKHPGMFVRWSREPDNEPLVGCDRPVAWIDDRVIGEAARTVDEQNACWGPLRRPAD